MGKALTKEEYCKIDLNKNKDYYAFEEYLVKFNILKSDGFWTTAVESYYAFGKGGFDNVKRRWMKDYKNCHTKLISIVYV